MFRRHMSGSHSHNHDHQDHHCPGHGASERRLLWAALITGIFTVIEVTGGYISGSLALIADAGHMLTDFAALIAAFIGIRIQRTAKSARAKQIPNYIALISGMSLYIIAGFILFEAYHRFHAPVEVLAGPMLIVAICGLIVNVIVFKILVGGDRENLNMRGAMLHVIGDILGSVAAIAAALIIMATGYVMADPILSALVAILIIVSAFPLVRDSLHAVRAQTPKTP